MQESAEPRPLGDSLDRARGAVAQMLEGELIRAVSGWFSGAREALATDEPGPPPPTDAAFEELPEGLRTLDVMQLSLAAMQRLVTRYQMAGYPPDVLITIPKSSCRTLDFHRAEEMIALGRAQTLQALEHAPGRW